LKLLKGLLGFGMSILVRMQKFPELFLHSFVFINVNILE